MIPDPLLTAFLETNYVVFSPAASFSLRIGKYSAGLAKLMSEHRANTAAILTAYNPGAAPVDIKANRDAQKLLLDSIQMQSVSYFFGENIPADADGPLEPTIVVMGMQLEQARALAEQFKQLAFVFSDARAIPELVWMHS
ncbi:DUF3293 domain-containing protein [Pollutimonas bauzanensis]|jgi:hypothetical protein|uniref:DUF3293 domain-containing protein n=1 Tax=Pollutimonas bauzanensis TaxID=658167 RepID=UPI00333EA3A2